MKLFEYIDVLNTPYDIFNENIENSGYTVPPHWHYYCEILYIRRGRVKVT